MAPQFRLAHLEDSVADLHPDAFGGTTGMHPVDEHSARALPGLLDCREIKTLLFLCQLFPEEARRDPLFEKRRNDDGPRLAELLHDLLENNRLFQFSFTGEIF